MATQAKKSSSGQSAKLATATATTASNAANKAAQVTLSAVETTRNSAESVVRMGTDAVKEFMSTGTDEAQRVQEKLFAIGRESVDNITKSANAATKTINETLAMSRDNVEACIECGNIASNIAQTMSQELVSFANNAFSENVEISKEVFSCRNINDFFELQSRILKNNIDSIFTESVKLTEMAFQLASEVAEPLNERVAEATERFSKSLAA